MNYPQAGNSCLLAKEDRECPIGMVIAVPKVKGAAIPDPMVNPGKNIQDVPIPDYCSTLSPPNSNLKIVHERLPFVFLDDSPIKSESVASDPLMPPVMDNSSFGCLLSKCDEETAHTKPIYDSDDDHKVAVARILVHNRGDRSSSSCFIELDPIRHDGWFKDQEVLVALKFLVKDDPELLYRFYWDSDPERLDVRNATDVVGFVQELIETQLPCVTLESDHQEAIFGDTAGLSLPLRNEESVASAMSSHLNHRFVHWAASIRQLSRRLPVSNPVVPLTIQAFSGSTVDYDGDDEHSETTESSEEAGEAMIFIHDNLSICYIELDASKYGNKFGGSDVLEALGLLCEDVPQLVFQVKRASSPDSIVEKDATGVVDYVERIVRSRMSMVIAAPHHESRRTGEGPGVPLSNSRHRFHEKAAGIRPGMHKKQKVFDLRDERPGLHG